MRERTAVWLLLSLLVLYFLVSTLGVVRQGMFDFTAYLRSGKLVLANGDIYALPSHNEAYYAYPPMVAYFFVPFAGIEPFLARALWYFGTLILLVATCGAIVSLTSEAKGASFWLEWGILLCIAFLTYPTWVNAKHGQINALTFALYVLSLLLLRRRYPVWAGIVLGAVASIKLVPLALVAHALWKRDTKYGVTALLSFVAIQATPLLLMPEVSAKYWLEVSPVIVWRSGEVNLSLANLAYAWSSGNWALVWIGFGVASAALAAPYILRIQRRGVSLIEIALIITATGLFGPVVESHHLLWMLLPIWIAVRVLFEQRSIPLLVMMASALFFYSQPFRSARILERFTPVRFPGGALQGGTILTIGTILIYLTLMALTLSTVKAPEAYPTRQRAFAALAPPQSDGARERRTPLSWPRRQRLLQ